MLIIQLDHKKWSYDNAKPVDNIRRDAGTCMNRILARRKIE